MKERGIYIYKCVLFDKSQDPRGLYENPWVPYINNVWGQLTPFLSTRYILHFFIISLDTYIYT
jgi:hypothetical protein